MFLLVSLLIPLCVQEPWMTSPWMTSPDHLERAKQIAMEPPEVVRYPKTEDKSKEQNEVQMDKKMNKNAYTVTHHNADADTVTTANPDDIIVTDTDLNTDIWKNIGSKRCKPWFHVSFVKIHKTGSGAVHNMLVRLVLNHNLSMAIPHCKTQNKEVVENDNKPKNYLANGKGGKKIKTKDKIASSAVGNGTVDETDHQKFDLFFDHAVYNPQAQHEFMHQDTRFITRIRHPFSHAKSVFDYFKIAKKSGLKSESAFDDFMIQNGSDIFKYGLCFEPKSKPGAPLTRNLQAYYLGYSNAINNDVDDFKQYLKKLDRELFFVWILEMNEESSVLLKRKMCWTTRDMLQIHTHKTRGKRVEKSSTMRLAQEEHKRRSTLDYLLYEFFLQKLKDEIATQSVDFKEEVEEFRSINNRFTDLCEQMCYEFAGINPRNLSLIRQKLSEGIHVNSSKFHPVFTMTYLDCLLLISKETEVKKSVRVKQFPSSCKNSRTRKTVRISDERCDFDQHVFPGLHINYFRKKVLNKESCLGNYMKDA